MPQKCTICTHPKKTEIEKAIAAGSESRRNLAARYKTSTGALGRHARGCVLNALVIVRAARDSARDADHHDVTVATVRNAVAAQARDVTLDTAITIEKELARSFLELNKLADALDAYLDDPDQPGTYTLDPRADQAMIVWEELELESETAEGEKPKWIKRRGTLQQALALAFSNSHRRLVSTEAISVSDPRELLLKMLAQRCRQIEIMAKLEGRYTAPAPLSDGNTIQLVWVQQVLIQNGILKG